MRTSLTNLLVTSFIKSLALGLTIGVTAWLGSKAIGGISSSTAAYAFTATCGTFALALAIWLCRSVHRRAYKLAFDRGVMPGTNGGAFVEMLALFDTTAVIMAASAAILASTLPFLSVMDGMVSLVAGAMALGSSLLFALLSFDVRKLERILDKEGWALLLKIRNNEDLQSFLHTYSRTA